MKWLEQVIVYGLLNLMLVEAETPLDFLSKFNQNDYEVKFERLELAGYDPVIVKQGKIVTFKYNRTTALSNISVELYKDLGNNIDIMVQVYKFLSNEYRVFPIRFRVNYCDVLKLNIAGSKDNAKCGNSTDCPFYKNRNYYTCNFHPDGSKLPPFIPSGSYMVEINYIADRFNKNPYMTWKAYATIYRSIQ